MNVEQIAELCHEINRIYCLSIGDASQPTWADAPEWQKKSARTGVMFHMTNPDAGEAGSHNSWMAEKLSDGWKYGPVKDVEKKEHPCMVPYGDLPALQRYKDALFVTIVRQAVKS